MTKHQKPGMGAFHPIIFFLFVYGISLFMALFVCRTVYYSIHDSGGNAAIETSVEPLSSPAVAIR